MRVLTKEAVAETLARDEKHRFAVRMAGDVCDLADSHEELRARVQVLEEALRPYVDGHTHSGDEIVAIHDRAVAALGKGDGT